MRMSIGVFGCVGLIVAAGAAQAQNLLFNGDLELTPADVYYDGFDPSLADDVPGWQMFLGAADGSWVYVNGVGSGNVDVDLAPGPAGGGLETAALSRPAVVPGNSYTATVTYDNYSAPNGAAYFIDWYDGGDTFLSSVGGPLGDPNGPLEFFPYSQKFLISGVAPANAATAGVRFTAGTGSYAGMTADNFSFVPEPSSIVLAALTALGLSATVWRRRR